MLIDGTLEGVIGASAITDIYYVVKKSRNDSQKALDAVIALLETITIVDTTAQDIIAATISPVSDFEDAVVAATSKRENVEYIITRNTKDFLNASIPAITPEDFVQKFSMNK